MKTLWAVWSEGYSTNSDRSAAQRMGVYEADSFQEACDIFGKQADMPELYDSVKLTYWGCRLFDNETDARALYG